MLLKQGFSSIGKKGKEIMLSIREYAKRQGITLQAVYQSLKSQENQERLQGHIITENGKKMLDDYAVSILDESRKRNPVVIMQEENSERVAELEEQNEKLTTAVMELQEKLLYKQEIIEKVQDKLIQAKENELQLLTSQSDTQALKEQIQSLENELQREKSKTWIDKLFKRNVNRCQADQDEQNTKI